MIKRTLGEKNLYLYSGSEGCVIIVYWTPPEAIDKRLLALRFEGAKWDLYIKVGGLFKLVMQFRDFIIPGRFQEQCVRNTQTHFPFLLTWTQVPEAILSACRPAPLPLNYKRDLCLITKDILQADHRWRNVEEIKDHTFKQVKCVHLSRIRNVAFALVTIKVAET